MAKHTLPVSRRAPLYREPQELLGKRHAMYCRPKHVSTEPPTAGQKWHETLDWREATQEEGWA